MKRTVNWCLLVLIAALALPKIASAQDEGTAYANFYAEENCAQKAPMGEQFITTYRTSQYVEGVVLLTSNCYYKAKNFAKVSDFANRLDQMAPNMKPTDKARVYSYAMDLAQQGNNGPQTIAYGEKIIAIIPDDFNTLLTLASTISTSNAPDKAAIAKALGYGEKAGKLLAGMDAKSQGMSDEAWTKQKTAIEGSLHQTMGTLYFNSQDFDKAADELAAATKDTPKDGFSWYLLGLAYNQQYAAQVKPYTEAVNKSNALRKGDQALLDEARATASALEDSLREKRDQAIDALATAVALGGSTQQPAMEQLKKLYTDKNNGSTVGLDQLISSKKPAQ